MGLIKYWYIVVVLAIFALVGCDNSQTVNQDTSTTVATNSDDKTNPVNAPESLGTQPSRENNTSDTTPPTITLNGSSIVHIFITGDYNELGAYAKDDVDGLLEVNITGKVDILKIGSYHITYTATDRSGNQATKIRIVSVYEDADVDTPTPTQGTKTFQILSPPSGMEIEYNSITMEISASLGNSIDREVSSAITNIVAKNTSLNTPKAVNGVKNGLQFLIYNIELIQGENKIEIKANNASLIKTITILSKANSTPPVSLSFDKIQGFDQIITKASISHAGLDIQSASIEIGDETAEINLSTLNTEFNLTNGSFEPKLTVRTKDNLLFTATGERINILQNPLVANSEIELGTASLDANPKIRDMDEYAEHIYALGEKSIFKISKDNPKDTREISLPNISNADGFGFDYGFNGGGDIYIANTQGNDIVKLLASNTYAIDTNFTINSTGVNQGTISAPKDVVISGSEEDRLIFVLMGNEIKIYDHQGVYLQTINGSTTNEGVLKNPKNMIGSRNLIITDFGNGILREITYNRLDNSITGEVLFRSNNFGKVTFSSNGLLLPDLVGEQLVFMYQNGEVIKQIPLSTNNKETEIAVAYENNYQLLTGSHQANKVWHTLISITPPEAMPQALTQKFVKAYLGDDEGYITQVASQSLINLLKTKDEEVKEIFAQFTKYKELVYFHGLKALVHGIISTNQGEVSIKFYFDFSNEKWQMNRVL